MAASVAQDSALAQGGMRHHFPARGYLSAHPVLSDFRPDQKHLLTNQQATS
jgi:hypothetical protein